MSMRGDGKPVSFIEDCAVPLEHLAEYTTQLTRGVRNATGRAAPGTRTRRSARCTCGRSSTCGATARTRCARSPRKPPSMVREYKGAFSGEHGDGLVRSEWVAWQFGAAAHARVRRDQGPVRSRGADESGQDRAAVAGWTTRACSASSRATRRAALTPALDWSAWNVQNDPATESVIGARHRRRSRAGFRQGRRDVQQQRPLPQVRRRHHVPELPRHARRTAPDARPREHAAPGAARPARRDGFASDAVRRGAGPLRQLQGLQARLPDRRRHGADEDRVPAPLARARTDSTLQGSADRAPAALRAMGVARGRGRSTCATRCRARRRCRRDGSASRRNVRSRAGARDTFLKRLPSPLAAARAARRPTSCCSSTPSTTTSSRKTPTRRSTVLRAAGYACRSRARRRRPRSRPPALLRPNVPRERPRRRGPARSAPRARGALAAFAARHPDRRARAVVPAVACVTNSSRWAWVTPARTLAANALTVRRISGARGEGRRPETAAARVAGQTRAAAWSLPPESVRRGFDPVKAVLGLIPQLEVQVIESSCCGMAGSFGYDAAHYAVSMQMAELSLLPAVRAQPDALIVANGTSCRHQIADGVRDRGRREAVHVARVLAQALNVAPR